MSKKIIAQVVNTVKFKKIDGTLMLLENNLSWKPARGDAKMFQCPYSEIKGLLD